MRLWRGRRLCVHDGTLESRPWHEAGLHAGSKPQPPKGLQSAQWPLIAPDARRLPPSAHNKVSGGKNAVRVLWMHRLHRRLPAPSHPPGDGVDEQCSPQHACWATRGGPQRARPLFPKAGTDPARTCLPCSFCCCCCCCCLAMLCCKLLTSPSALRSTAGRVHPSFRSINPAHARARAGRQAASTHINSNTHSTVHKHTRMRACTHAPAPGARPGRTSLGRASSRALRSGRVVVVAEQRVLLLRSGHCSAYLLVQCVCGVSVWAPGTVSVMFNLPIE